MLIVTRAQLRLIQGNRERFDAEQLDRAHRRKWERITAAGIFVGYVAVSLALELLTGRGIP
jgi:hypothetical protein